MMLWLGQVIKFQIGTIKAQRAWSAIKMVLGKGTTKTRIPPWHSSSTGPLYN